MFRLDDWLFWWKDQWLTNPQSSLPIKLIAGSFAPCYIICQGLSPNCFFFKAKKMDDKTSSLNTQVAQERSLASEYVVRRVVMTFPRWRDPLKGNRRSIYLIFSSTNKSIRYKTPIFALWPQANDTSFTFLKCFLFINYWLWIGFTSIMLVYLCSYCGSNGTADLLWGIKSFYKR